MKLICSICDQPIEGRAVYIPNRADKADLPAHRKCVEPLVSLYTVEAYASITNSNIDGMFKVTLYAKGRPVISMNVDKIVTEIYGR